MSGVSGGLVMAMLLMSAFGFAMPQSVVAQDAVTQNEGEVPNQTMASGINSHLPVDVDTVVPSDPAVGFMAFVAAKQWERAAGKLTLLRELAQGSGGYGLVKLPIPGQPKGVANQHATFERFDRYVNRITNAELGRHSELRKSWNRRIGRRLNSHLQRLESLHGPSRLQRITDLANRYLFASGKSNPSNSGAWLLHNAAAENAFAGDLRNASLFLSMLDPHFHRFQQRFRDASQSDLPGVFVDSSELQCIENSVPEIAARLVLQEMLRSPATASADLDWFVAEFADSEGQLGNRQGKLSGLLSEALPMDSSLESESPNKVERTQLPDESSRWAIEFPNSRPNELPSLKIIGDQVVWRNRQSIFAAGLHHGDPCFENGLADDTEVDAAAYSIWQSLRELNEIPNNIATDQFVMKRSSLSIDGSHVFGVFDENETNCIVGCDIDRQGRLLPGFPIRNRGASWQFECTPVVRDGMLFVLVSDYSPNDQQVDSYLVCYPLRINESTTQLVPKWSTRICRAAISKSRQPKSSGSPRTGGAIVLDGDQVLFNNDCGVVGAVGRRSGRVNWLLEYRRNDYSDAVASIYQSRLPLQRSGEVPLVLGDLVYVLPADSPYVLAINKHFGSVTWESRLPACNQSLDVSQESLLLGGDQLVWLDPASGAILQRFPAGYPNTLPGMRRNAERVAGRPAVDGDHVLFTMHDGLFSLPVGIRTDRSPTDILPTRVLDQSKPDNSDSKDETFGAGHLTTKNGMMLIGRPGSILAIPQSTASGHQPLQKRDMK